MLNRIYRETLGKWRQIEWGFFWLLEVLILALPLFIAILSLPPNSTISAVRLEALLASQLGFTVVNFILALSRIKKKRFLLKRGQLRFGKWT